MISVGGGSCDKCGNDEFRVTKKVVTGNHISVCATCTRCEIKFEDVYFYEFRGREYEKNTKN